MKCGKCDQGEYQRVKQELVWDDEFVGQLRVAAAVVDCCPHCGSKLLPPTACRQLEVARARKLTEWLEGLPLRGFWDSRQVTAYLGVSRQALSKGVQYRNLLYRLCRNGKWFYLAESVRQFKRTGDGRMALAAIAEMVVPRPEVMRAADHEASSDRTAPHGAERSSPAVRGQKGETIHA